MTARVPLLALMTAPDIDVARRIARTIVGEHLAACCNIIPRVESIYRWEGVVNEESEVLVVIKLGEAGFEALKQRVMDLHPYDVPELIGIPVHGGLDAYLEWMVGE